MFLQLASSARQSWDDTSVLQSKSCRQLMPGPAYQMAEYGSSCEKAVTRLTAMGRLILKCPMETDQN